MLLGDAAHPMLQYAAQGACQTLEDAVALARAVAGVGSDVSRIPGAFSAFAAARQARLARLVGIARWLGDEIYHASGPAAELRDLRLATLTDADLLEMLEPIHRAAPMGLDTAAMPFAQAG